MGVGIELLGCRSRRQLRRRKMDDTLLKPRVFPTAVAYCLGLPLLKEEIPCPLCKQTINIYGDHATCTHNGDIIIRHNTLRNLIDNFASDGLLAPQLEKQGILGNTTGRRPGDVTLQRWNAGGALAIDVAITSALGKRRCALRARARSMG